MRDTYDVDAAATMPDGSPGGDVGQPGSAGRRGGLTKRGRLLIIVVVAILLVGGLLTVHAIANHEADSAVKTAAASGAQAAKQIDNHTLFREWADWTVKGQSGQPPGTPHIAHAFLFREHIDPTSATLTYRISTWGTDRCFTVSKSGNVAAATILRTCPS